MGKRKGKSVEFIKKDLQSRINSLKESMDKVEMLTIGSIFSSNYNAYNFNIKKNRWEFAETKILFRVCYLNKVSVKVDVLALKDVASSVKYLTQNELNSFSLNLKYSAIRGLKELQLEDVKKDAALFVNYGYLNPKFKKDLFSIE